MMNLMISVLIVVIIIVLWWIVTRLLTSREQRILSHEFANTAADVFDSHAANVLRRTLNRQQLDANDEYRVGTIYEHNLHRPQEARRHYIRALREITVEPPQEFNFIIDRAEEALDRTRPQVAEINQFDVFNIGTNEFAVNGLFEQLDIGLIPFDNAPNGRWTIENVRTHARNSNVENMTNIPRAERIEYNVKWNSDPQNVHDTQVNKDLTKQFQQLVESNNRTVTIPAGDDVISYVANIIDNSEDPDLTPEKRQSARRTINRLRTSDPIILGIQKNDGTGAHEREILKAVCDRIRDPVNDKHRNDLESALVDSLADCFERGALVCPNGRASRMFTSLAMLDANPDMGLVRTREVMRNGCFEKAAEIRDMMLEKATPEMRVAYDKTDMSDDAIAFTERMKTEIENKLRADYSKEMSKTDLDRVIEEAKLAV